MINTLSKEQIRFIVISFKFENMSLKRIYEDLKDPVVAAKYGFKPHSLCLQYFYKKFDLWYNSHEDEINEIVQEYLNDWSEIPLAHLGNRLTELQTLATDAKERDNLSDYIKVVREIRANLESFGVSDKDKLLAGAIADSGGKTVNLIVAPDILLQIANNVKKSIEDDVPVLQSVGQELPSRKEEILSNEVRKH